MLKNGVFVLIVLFSFPVFGGLLDLFGGDDYEEIDVPVDDYFEDGEAPIVQAFDIIGVTLGATYPYLKSSVFPR
ncbi:MAG: hypothetical protein ACTSXV_02300, partial [Alphaproteobacteria bacterium]